MGLTVNYVAGGFDKILKPVNRNKILLPQILDKNNHLVVKKKEKSVLDVIVDNIVKQRKQQLKKMNKPIIKID